jgi:hypothetical protein
MYPLICLGTCKQAPTTTVLEDLPSLCQGWAAEAGTSATFLKYAYADRAGYKVVHSKDYKPPRPRVSYNVLVQYVEDGWHVSYFAVIQFFASETAPTCQQRRLAICHLHCVHLQPEAIGSMRAAEDMGKPTHEHDSVLCSHMLDKHDGRSIGKTCVIHALLQHLWRIAGPPFRSFSVRILRSILWRTRVYCHSDIAQGIGSMAMQVPFTVTEFRGMCPRHDLPV